MPDKSLCAEMLESAVASVEMEGYSVNEQQKAFCFEFVTGNINKEEFINSILKEI